MLLAPSQQGLQHTRWINAGAELLMKVQQSYDSASKWRLRLLCADKESHVRYYMALPGNCKQQQLRAEHNAFRAGPIENIVDAAQLMLEKVLPWVKDSIHTPSRPPRLWEMSAKVVTAKTCATGIAKTASSPKGTGMLTAGGF